MIRTSISTIIAVVTLMLGIVNVPVAFGMPPVVEIIEKDAKYQSEDIEVKVGQTIRLINKDKFIHQSQIRNVDEFGIEYPLVVGVVEAPDMTVDVSLDEPGRYKLRCKVHDGMVLNINVIQ